MNRNINKITYKIKLILLVTMMFFSILAGNSFGVLRIFAADSYILAKANTNYTTTKTNKAYITLADAIVAMKADTDADTVIVDAAGSIIAMKKGLAIFIKDATITFKDTLNGTGVYIRNNISGYYIHTENDGTVKTAISGMVGRVKADQVKLIPDAWVVRGTTTNRYFFDYYARGSSGDLIHYLSYYRTSSDANYSGSLTVDKAPDFIKSGKRYYSLNGYDFFEDPYDVISGTKSPIGTFFPYYKFLSYRSQTTYSAADINRYIKYASPTNSVLINQGQSFINAQNTWGVNAIMELAFANLESAYGSSDYAIKRYNIFGINATDTNPNGATYYTSISDCVTQHAKYLMSQGYLDAYAFINSSIKNNSPSFYDSGYIQSYTGDSRYLGSAPGNKVMGVNVKYASDPFHGEKIGGLAYLIDKYLGSKDYNKYSLAITNKATYAHLSANSTSWKLYQYTTKSTRDKTTAGPTGMPVVILGSEGDYYKIQSDMPMKEGLAYFSWEYDFNKAIAYVKKSDVRLLISQSIDKTALSELINTSFVSERELYTSVSLQIFDLAMEQAVQVIALSSANQLQIDQAKEALASAFQSLVKIPIINFISAIQLDYYELTVTDHLKAINLKTTVIPSNATLKNLKFSSSNEAVASVDQIGIITPIKNGLAKIFVVAIDGSLVTATLNLTIAIPTIQSSQYQIDNENNLIMGINLKTTIAALSSNLTGDLANSEIGIYDNGFKVTTGTLKTNMEVRLIVDGKIAQQLIIVVNSDLNGNGNSDISDFILFRNHLLNSKSLSGCYLEAADINSDGVVNISDFILMRNYLLKSE